ncbi:DUF167 domain-containing protein [Actimicrobium sp. CCC2.4]|uniref:DUF167 domain-containing protein n=1 Tax=Actimicrobium sp. CCC2.4 TaxID=3048606 RepID=UPI002AC96378|nr:DUF167 domain-containing protein [Actimicrobium sp. CCC2.4]MEB0134495.1 DUF167 domain-containing protein [Actimicrobium sp. CCC2.4]WPX33126.1 DUF167 domain-containing protein [Actimicrobium sp. CCC2.4]
MAQPSQPWCSLHADGVRLAVQVAANAKKTEVIGVADDVLKIKLHAQPIEGKANDALVRFIAAQLHVPRTAVTVTHGLTSKRKLLLVRSAGLSVDDARQALWPATPAGT